MEMKKDDGYLEFVHSENFRNQAEIWFKAYNILREKTELFHDFVVCIYDLVDSTYLGDEVTITDEDKKKHFIWCWNKVLTNFSKESIHFQETGKHLDYLWLFFYEAYYQYEGKSDRIKDYFKGLFHFDYAKTRSELDMLTELYKILDLNLKR